MTDVQITQLNIPEGMINFGVGQPDPKLLPLEAIRTAAAHRIQFDDPLLLAYGLEQGNGHFRIALAQFLSQHYAIPVAPNDLFITTGVSQAIDFICTLFTRTGDTIFVEEPSYFLALRIFADHNLQVVSIPMDEEGMDIDILEQKLAEHRPALVYTVPTYHNPSAITLSAARRKRLVELSQAHNFLIIADEVYHLLNYTSTPPLPFAQYIETGTVFSLGSFSKIMAPGLRVGWIQAGPKLIDRLVHTGLLDSGGGLNPFMSAVIESAITLDLHTQHLKLLKSSYQHRAAILSQELRQQLPNCSFTTPEGGFFIWLQFPDGIDAAQLRTQAKSKGVSFEPGISFSSRQALRNYARLCFAYYDVDDLREGVTRLAQLLP